MKANSVILFLFCAVAAFAAEPPLPPSPIAEFRGWLNSPEQRKIALAKRSPETRAAIQKKIDAYLAMPPSEREMKLTATEFQWYLKPLLKMQPGSSRDAAVAKVPVLWQPMVMHRLTAWDKMPLNLKTNALAHQLVVEYVSTPAHKQEAVLRSLSSEERAALMERLARWQILPASTRARFDERLREFFAFERPKREEVLDNFTPAERASMAQTLQAFGQLSREQREVCINSFSQFAGKFAAMDRTNQIAFLKNADRWQEMSQEERDTWRKVVAIVPPMPPLPIPQPPMPGAPLPPTPR